MSFTIRPATRSDSKVLIGLYAQSGAGKTMSALLLGRGLVGPAGRIVLIDTESGRGELYADVIPGGYDTIPLSEPFSPQRYIEAVQAAEGAGADCIIIDSMSHEWESLGGVTDMAAEIERRTGKSGLHCWKEPKIAHQRLVLHLLRSKTHIICCLRAKRKSKQVRDERTGKQVVVKDDFYSPKQDGDFIFEMQVHAEILSDHKLRVTKVSHPALATIFRDGVVISEETGRALAEWARGGTIKTTAPASAPPAAEQAEADRRREEMKALVSRLRAEPDQVEAIMAEDATRDLVVWLLEHQKQAHAKLFEIVNGVRRDQRTEAA